MEARALHPFWGLRQNLAQVYNPKARPWIKPHNATTEQLMNQVAQCPSGALSIKDEK